MRLIDRARQMLGVRQKSAGGSAGPLPPTWPSNWFQIGYPSQPSQTRGGSVVESCVQAYAQTIAQLPARQYTLDENGTKTYVTNSNLARVLAKPNGFQTSSDFMLNAIYSLLYNGNAYFFGYSPGTEKPKEIFLLDPAMTRAHRVAETGDVFYSTSGEFWDTAMGEVQAPDGRSMIPERYIGHIRLYTPRDPLIGVTPLENAAQSVSAHGSITNNQAAFFQNMSRPSGFLSTDMEINKDQMLQLRDAWEDQSKNLNSGGVPILASGMKWNAMTISSQDAQLVEAWRMTVEDISRVFRVPPMLINSMEKATFDNAETLMRFWLASGLGFMINHIELVYAAFYGLDSRYEGVELKQDLLLQADLKSRMEALGTGVSKGLMAPNEGRGLLGLKPVDGGDIPFIQQQNIPLDVASTGAQVVDLNATPEAPPVEEPPAEDEKDFTFDERALALLVRSHAEEMHDAA